MIHKQFKFIKPREIFGDFGRNRPELASFPMTATLSSNAGSFRLENCSSGIWRDSEEAIVEFFIEQKWLLIPRGLVFIFLAFEQSMLLLQRVCALIDTISVFAAPSTLDPLIPLAPLSLGIQSLARLISTNNNPTQIKIHFKRHGRQ
ncbi:hypothetical protein CDAR_454761 [Caerostris darwini]|uniref:Uncharacterized protein n=1 Tax=Caerostris darwini TaxID=1538125 RepID=A0AAV4TZ70_9ARAC|nr:hypothetical protein CDAR_454761 [Caerostris darwini]